MSAKSESLESVMNGSRRVEFVLLGTALRSKHHGILISVVFAASCEISGTYCFSVELEVMRPHRLFKRHN
jgi:hypothetical protein